jgi:hypothetical protein
VSKFLGFLLGVVAALMGPAAFGVLAADGGIELNAKEMALAYGIGALIFWAVVSYFSGAAALGAALTFGAMIYAVHWIPNRTTNFLNDIPGVTTGMIDGIKQYTLNGVVPILAVISLVYAIQLITQSVQRRRRERAEAERQLREQEAAQAAQEEAAYPAAGGEYPVGGAGGEYPTTAENRFSTFGNGSYDDLFEEEPEPIRPRLQAEEQTMQFAPAPAAAEQTAVVDAESNDDGEDTQLMASDRDETVAVTTEEPTEEPAQEEEEAPAAEAAEEQPEAAEEQPEAEQEEEQQPPEAQVQPFHKEEVGQQYRERMDGPDPEDTGEFHTGAFENPNPIAADRPQAPRILDLPGQFRPAGA